MINLLKYKCITEGWIDYGTPSENNELILKKGAPKEIVEDFKKLNAELDEYIDFTLK